MLLFMLSYQISTGVGVWGNRHPVMWAWDIVNFVWWIGIGHAGTLDLGHFVSAAPTLAHRREPRRRSHDHFRGHVRRHLSRHARRARLVRLVAVPHSQLPTRFGRSSARR